MENDFILIYQTSNPIQAEIILQMLKENSIDAFTMNKRDSSYQAFGLIEIYCPANEVIIALHLINTHSNHHEE